MQQSWICQPCSGKQEFPIHSNCHVSCSWQIFCASAASSIPSSLCGSFSLPACYLSSAFVTYSRWMSLPCLCAGCRGGQPLPAVSERACLEITYGLGVAARGMGSFWGTALGGCTKLTVGCLRRVPKSGERERLGEKPAWKTKGERYKGVWSRVNKRCLVLVSGQAVNALCLWVSTVFLSWINVCGCTQIYLYTVWICAPLPYWEDLLSLASAWMWGHRSSAASPLLGARFGKPWHHQGHLCCLHRGQELWLGYKNGVCGCLVTLRYRVGSICDLWISASQRFSLLQGKY